SHHNTRLPKIKAPAPSLAAKSWDSRTRRILRAVVLFNAAASMTSLSLTPRLDFASNSATRTALSRTFICIPSIEGSTRQDASPHIACAFLRLQVSHCNSLLPPSDLTNIYIKQRLK